MDRSVIKVYSRKYDRKIIGNGVFENWIKNSKFDNKNIN